MFVVGFRKRVCVDNHFTFSSLQSTGYNSDLWRVTRERDELQEMLDRFEKHMVEIQSSVKVLTMERDKFRGLYDQVNLIKGRLL